MLKHYEKKKIIFEVPHDNFYISLRVKYFRITSFTIACNWRYFHRVAGHGPLQHRAYSCSKRCYHIFLYFYGRLNINSPRAIPGNECSINPNPRRIGRTFCVIQTHEPFKTASSRILCSVATASVHSVSFSLQFSHLLVSEEKTFKWRTFRSIDFPSRLGSSTINVPSVWLLSGVRIAMLMNAAPNESPAVVIGRISTEPPLYNNTWNVFKFYKFSNKILSFVFGFDLNFSYIRILFLSLWISFKQKPGWGLWWLFACAHRPDIRMGADLWENDTITQYAVTADMFQCCSLCLERYFYLQCFLVLHHRAFQILVYSFLITCDCVTCLNIY